MMFRHSSVIRRFLRARQYSIPKAKVMIKKCIEWRKTVQGVGIDELYKELDPYDVRMLSLSVDMNFMIFYIRSIQREKRSSSIGRYGITRCVVVFFDP